MIDTLKIQNLKNLSGKIQGQCPVCFENGNDRSGEHLVLFPDGRFGCVIDDSKEHRARILQLIGLGEGQEIEIPKYKQPIPQVEKIYPDEILDGLIKDHSYYLNKGINEKVLIELRGGKAFKGSMAGRYVFPIFDLKGRIHGFSGRALYKNPNISWKHLGIKSNWVYPAHFISEDIRWEKTIILVESIGDLIALMSAGIRNVLVLFGVNLHKNLLSYLIAQNPNKIYVATNNDFKHSVGQDAAERIAGKLCNYFDESKIEIKLPTKKDFGEMTEEEIQTWRKELC